MPCFSGKASLSWASKCQQHDISLPRRGTVLDHRGICLTQALANFFRSPSSTAKRQAGQPRLPRDLHSCQQARGPASCQGQRASSHFPPASLFSTGCFVCSTPAPLHPSSAGNRRRGGDALKNGGRRTSRRALTPLHRAWRAWGETWNAKWDKNQDECRGIRKKSSCLSPRPCFLLWHWGRKALNAAVMGGGRCPRGGAVPWGRWGSFTSRARSG